MTNSDMVDKILAEPTRPPAWWHNYRWIASLAALIMAISYVVIAVVVIQTEHSTEDLIRRQAQNTQVLDRIQVSQRSLDELTNFVNNLPNQPQSKVTLDFFTILCSNPVYTPKCQQLGRP